MVVYKNVKKNNLDFLHIVRNYNGRIHFLDPLLQYSSQPICYDVHFVMLFSNATG